MTPRKTTFRRRPDYVSEEMATALLAQPTYEFNDLFQAVFARLKARNATSGGEEMLRLRVYEKLQILATQGVVKKEGKKYTANPVALRARAAEILPAKVAAPAKQSGWTLHAE